MVFKRTDLSSGSIDNQKETGDFLQGETVLLRKLGTEQHTPILCPKRIRDYQGKFTCPESPD
jgi:hypothetical protein